MESGCAKMKLTSFYRRKLFQGQVRNLKSVNLRTNLLARSGLPSAVPGRRNTKPTAEPSSALANRMITIP
jgi:hypothetical protein